MGEKETPTDEEVERLKTKTKSNQSNDFTDQEGGGGGAGGGPAARDVSERATWTTSNPGIGKAAINNTKSNIKGEALDGPGGDLDGDGVPESAEGKFYDQKTNEKGRMATDDGMDDDGDAQAAVNTSHSNIKNQREGGVTHEDDWEQSAAKLAPDKPVKSEIAIGDPGVNGNLEVDDGDSAGDAARVRPGYDIKSNTK